MHLKSQTSALVSSPFSHLVLSIFSVTMQEFRVSYAGTCALDFSIIKCLQEKEKKKFGDRSGSELVGGSCVFDSNVVFLLYLDLFLKVFDVFYCQI